ncbi:MULTISPECIES: pyrroline-5-carboxylate reductase [Paenibacillus]|uniref:pyrroline-5-carboxylate reductase n=1 Tax=Paenibacillus TaxID=44249 RepID=UPI0022B8B0FE|nr:pyrroline-5-carboxylate reductase [Paenibacillus caseinilyticus]MCZ8518810.1 pyrroline-5-carboxylate reductase [Paenibacillus caseinilyticus]
MVQGLPQQQITFVGAGSMAEAIIRGLIDQGGVPGENLFVVNRSNAERLAELHTRYGIRYAMDQLAKDEAIRSADIVVLAFKPKDAVDGILALKPQLRPGQLIVSVIAGLSVATMHGLLGSDSYAIVRTMPNTSSTIGLGATGIAFSESVTEKQQELAYEMFASTGIVTVVDESQIDAITGVSGSGPAYVYYMMEAMMEGGTRAGLSREESRRLTIQTFLGAAGMVEATGEEPADLRRKVTSPNGTTQAAIEVMDRAGFQDALIAGILRSKERAGEMGEAISQSVSTPSK